MPDRPKLPPPPPGSIPKSEQDPVRWSQVAPVLAVVAIVSTAVMAVLWLSARDDADEARADAERSAALLAEAERGEADARAALEQAQTDLDAASAEGDDTVDAAEIAALDEEITALEGENEALRSDVDALQTELDEATAPAPESTDADETDVAETTTTTTTTTTTEPEPEPEPDAPAVDLGFDLGDPQQVGQFLGNLYRDSVLGSGQETCIGESVAAEVGDDLGPILSSEDPGADDRLVTALTNAGDTCQIDPTAIFG